MVSIINLVMGNHAGKEEDLQKVSFYCFLLSYPYLPLLFPPHSSLFSHSHFSAKKTTQELLEELVNVIEEVPHIHVQFLPLVTYLNILNPSIFDLRCNFVIIPLMFLRNIETDSSLLAMV